MSKKILLKKLGFVCEKLGKTVGYEEGQWSLCHAAYYGGYVVVEFMKNGGQRHPLLNKRLSASCMADALDMALSVLS